MQSQGFTGEDDIPELRAAFQKLELDSDTGLAVATETTDVDNLPRIDSITSQASSGGASFFTAIGPENEIELDLPNWMLDPITSVIVGLLSGPIISPGATSTMTDLQLGAVEIFGEDATDAAPGKPESSSGSDVGTTDVAPEPSSGSNVSTTDVAPELSSGNDVGTTGTTLSRNRPRGPQARNSSRSLRFASPPRRSLRFASPNRRNPSRPAGKNPYASPSRL